MYKYLILVVIAVWGGALNATAQTEAADSTMAVELNDVVVSASSIVNTATGYRVRLAGQEIVTAKSTTDVLNYLPNVSVEQGNIKINGLTASEITVNGRKIYDRSELERLSAEMIESVEVKYSGAAKNITNSAGGSIAIKLKPLHNNGYYGNAYAGSAYGRRQGIYNAFLGGSVFAKVGRLDIYEAPYLFGMDYDEWFEQRIESLVSGNEESNEKVRQNKRQGNFTNTLSLNYDINASHSLGVSWRTAYNKNKSSDFSSGSKSLMMRQPGHQSSNVVSATYTGTLSKKGDQLQVSADWMNRHAEMRQLFFNSPINDLLQNGNSNLYEINADFEHPFGKKHRFNTGFTYRRVHIEQDQSSSEIPDGIISRTKVTAQTPQPYASMQGNLWRFRYYAALNWQQNSVKVGSEKTYSQNAVNPSLQISLPFGDNSRHRVSVTYKHTLGNVPYDAISEKKTWVDPYSYSVGNRDLKASRDQYLTANISLWNSSLNFSASYSYTGNEILWQSFNDEVDPDVTYTKPINIGASHYYALRGEYMRKFFGVWTIKAFARLSFSPENQTISGVTYDKTRLHQYYSVFNSISFRDWGLGAEFWIEPTYRSYDRTMHTVYQCNVIAYKTFLKRTLQVRVDLKPFEQRRRIDRRTSDRLVSMRYTTPAQILKLQVTWFFMGGKKGIRVNVNNPSLGYEESRDNR